MLIKILKKKKVGRGQGLEGASEDRTREVAMGGTQISITGLEGGGRGHTLRFRKLETEKKWIFPWGFQKVG